MKFAIVLMSVLIVAQISSAACLKNLAAVQQHEQDNPSCKAKFVETLWENFKNKELSGTGMASGYKIKFTGVKEKFSLNYQGNNLVGTLCCKNGNWSMQNSQGVQSLGFGQGGILIGGFLFKAPGASKEGQFTRTAARPARQ